MCDCQAFGFGVLSGKVRQDRFKPFDRRAAVVRQRTAIDVIRLLRDPSVVQFAEQHHFADRLLLASFEKTDALEIGGHEPPHERRLRLEIFLPRYDVHVREFDTLGDEVEEWVQAELLRRQRFFRAQNRRIDGSGFERHQARLRPADLKDGHVCRAQAQLPEREPHNEVGVAAKTADADLFTAQLLCAGDAAATYQDVWQDVRDAADDFEPRAPQICVEERWAAGLEEVKAFTNQRLCGKRTARDENQFEDEPVFAEDARVLSHIKRGGSVKAVEAHMQSRVLRRGGLRATAPESEDQDRLDGDPFHNIDLHHLRLNCPVCGCWSSQ